MGGGWDRSGSRGRGGRGGRWGRSSNWRKEGKEKEHRGMGVDLSNPVVVAFKDHAK